MLLLKTAASRRRCLLFSALPADNENGERGGDREKMPKGLVCHMYKRWTTKVEVVTKSQSSVQGYSSGQGKGSVKCFFQKVPLACLGSMAAAVQPNGRGDSQKIFPMT